MMRSAKRRHCESVAEDNFLKSLQTIFDRRILSSQVSTSSVVTETAVYRWSFPLKDALY